MQRQIDPDSERPLSRDDIERLVAAELIPRDEALLELRGTVRWSGWIRRWLESLGSIFLMAGILFFFAHNWKEMSPTIRFAILEIGVVGTVIAALIVGIQKTTGQWLISGASVLTGVLIAVYGQVYQTGADAFEVFAMWAGLILVWVAVAKFAPLWVFWLVVAETAIVLFGGQVLVPDKVASWPTIFIALGLFTTLALFIYEKFQSIEWLRQGWIRIALVAAAIFWFSSIPMRWIFGFGYRNDETIALGIGTVLWAASCGIGFWFYSVKKPALSPVSACILSPALLVVFWAARIFLENGYGEALGWLAVGVFAIVVFSAASWIIIFMGKQIKSEAQV